MREITSINNAYIKELAKLKEKKYALASDCYLVEGKHLVEEAYKHHALKEIIADEESYFFQDIEATLVPYDILKKLCDTVNPQHVVGIVRKRKYELDYALIKSILILDAVSDPGNLGTLIRTAAGLDIDLIILSNDTVDLYNPKVIRSTQGAIFSLPIIQGDIKVIISELKKKGYQVFGTALRNAVELKKAKKVENYAIVLGNEAQGIKEEILSLCDQLVKIDITDKVESLNVAIAGAIAMFYFKD